MKRKSEDPAESNDIKIPKSINTSFGMSFRRRLRTENAISALQEFVKANKEQNVVDEYVNAGGSVKELMELMKQFDTRNNFLVASTILSAITHVILRVVSDLLLKQDVTEESCKELLSSYQTTLQNMLTGSSSSINYRKVILKLLTAMVSLSPKLAKIILSSFPFTGKFLKTFTTSSSSSKSVRKLRTSFIYFLLSFLLDDNPALIAELLQKKGLLTSVIPSLINDPLEVILLVLNTFRLKIVENIKISKTLKLHTFNTTVLREFLKLYDLRRNSDRDNVQDTDDNDEDDEGKAKITVDAVKSAVHELLVLLCTSSKKGILFRQQKTTNVKDSNQLIFTLLEDMKKPWENELKSNLIAEILKACPEFVENIFVKWKLDLQPRVSNEWIKLINFLILVVGNQTPESSDLSYAKITALFPTVLQRLFSRNINDASIHPHPVVRYYLMRLLLTMLQNMSDALILSEEPSRKINSINLREQVSQFLQKIVIPCTKLLNAWKNGLECRAEDIEDESFNDIQPDAFPRDEYYLVLIELLLLYHSLIPISFSELRMMDIVDFNNYHDAVNSSEFKFKLAHLIFLIYNPKPSEANFNFMMKQFVEYYANNDDSKIGVIVETVLKSISFFDGFEEEIMVWMHGLKKCGSSDLFVEALSLAVLKSTQFVEQMTSLNQQHSLNLNFNNDENLDLNTVEEVESLLEMDKAQLSSTKPPTVLSSVLFTFLEILKSKKYSDKKSIRKFTSAIFVHLMHLQSFVKPLKTLLKENENMYIESRVMDFISYWDQDELKSEPPPYPLDCEDFSVFLYSNLLSESSFDELQASRCVDNLNECDAVLAWNMCTFFTVRLEQMNELDPGKGNFLLTMFQKLLDQMSRPKAVACLGSLLKNHYFVNGFIIECTATNSMIPIILVNIVSNWSSIIPRYSHLVAPYRYKFVNLIMSQRKRKVILRINREGFTIDKLLQFLTLPEQTVIDLLQLLIPMPSKTYMKGSEEGVSEWTELIVCLLNITIDFMERPLSNEYFVLLISKLNDVRKKNGNIRNILDSIIRYIRTFPHQLEHIPKDLVEDICRNSSPSIYELAAYLIACDQSLAGALQEQIVENVSLVDIDHLLKTLDRIESVAGIDVRILRSIHKLHLQNVNALLNFDDYLRWQNKNGKWIENIISQLDEKSCLRMCNRIESVFPTLELNEEKCIIVRTYFKKASKIFVYVKLLVEKFHQLLKDREDVSWLCDEISRNIDCDVDFSELLDTSSWEDFVKLCLKSSIHSDNAVIMRTFKNVCNKVLRENSKDATTSVFKWMISHSEFANRMLNNSALKVEMIELLLVLTRMNPTEMSANHVPLLLSAYKASLAKSDQLLLQLLQWYENSGIRFSDCRPYLWGEAAASHYSVRAEMTVSLARHPLPNQVLESFNIEIIKNTIKYFPLDRPLWPENYSHVDLDAVYDLAFVLPLLSHLLAPESRISVQKFCRSGALCLVLIALSCEDNDLRMAAFHCLQRFEFHLHSREKEVQIWQQFVNALKNGLIAIDDSEKSDEEPPRLPCLVTTFLANMSLIICEPLNSLYGPVSSFLLAKPSFDLNSIPNFFMLFYSTDLKYRDHQKWILKIIRDGMRYEKDWIVAQRNFLFKFMLQYYASSLSNESVNLIILQILANALRIEKCRSFMLTKSSLLPWINQIVRSTSVENQPSFLPLIMKILGSLISAKNSRHLYSTLILLLYKLKSSNVALSQVVLEEFLEVLSKCSKNTVLSERDVILTIDIASTFLDSRKQKLFHNILKFKSVLFVDEHCDNGCKVENCISRIVEKLVRKN